MTTRTRAAAALLICTLACLSSPGRRIGVASAFSAPNKQAPAAAAAAAAVPSSSTSASSSDGGILILDHLNINHEKGRHDLLRAFYFDFLKCAVDPRKEENLASGKKTLWANVGANQFHLPEGRPDAQVFDGVITLVYPTLDGLKERYGDGSIRDALGGTEFDVVASVTGNGGEEQLLVTDPWGTQFRIIAAATDDPAAEVDPRGAQKGGPSEGLSLRDLTVYVAPGSNLAGIGRFYERIFDAPVSLGSSSCVVKVGPTQTLTFMPHPAGKPVAHEDLVDDGDERVEEGRPHHYLSNYGPHVSMYVRDLRSCYGRAADLGLAYVNPRFKRRAYTLEEAVDDCMFRCLDVVDPDDVESGPILRLEHEVRSVVKRDGSKYKSCPFDEIPAGCVV